MFDPKLGENNPAFLKCNKLTSTCSFIVNGISKEDQIKCYRNMISLEIFYGCIVEIIHHKCCLFT